MKTLKGEKKADSHPDGTQGYRLVGATDTPPTHTHISDLKGEMCGVVSHHYHLPITERWKMLRRFFFLIIDRFFGWLVFVLFYVKSSLEERILNKQC